ncbi:MAG: hypothetical protein COA79_00245 [Planctomycetota bacterium]|nr:MAG: hypothetical protein COA79_00245 [Planctomycetota bacterium]
MILVTGAAGFIGFHLSKKLLENDHEVVGYDCINDYYDVALKNDRLEILKKFKNFNFLKGSLENNDELNNLFNKYDIDYVVNLAAQAGVRYSLENPSAYIQSNLVGFANVLEACRHNKVKNLVYASTSSVYGLNENMPFRECDSVNHPLTLYAATKKSNEMMAHSYSNLFNIPTTGLRFFTVYGPWGRPDMALFLFTKAMVNNEPINVFNNGNMIRDFTYVEDIVEGVSRVLFKPAEPIDSFDLKDPRPDGSTAPYRIFNIGNQQPVKLMDYIKEIERNLGLKAKINFMPMQDGDVPATQSDTSSLKDWVDYQPLTLIDEGIRRFIDWYKEYYSVDIK